MIRKTIIRRPEVSKRTGLSKSSIYLLMSRGMFPERVQLGLRAVGWYEDAIDQWIDSRQKKVAR